jgi:hypothetical protein
MRSFILTFGLALSLLSLPIDAAVLKVGPQQLYKRPSQAAAIANNGDIIEIDAGTYIGDVAIWRQHDLTIRGIGGRAHIKANGKAAQGKAIWVIKGNNTTVENIEFSGTRVRDRNGAGIRQEGRDLTVRYCYFHDNENGILGGGGIILIEYSEFARNGHGDGKSHNLYISRKTDMLTVRFSYLHHANIGHNLKSRAQENFILYNRLMDEKTGNSSYIVDLPNGGIAYLIGNLIQQGPKTENFHLVSFGAEGLKHPRSELYVVNNTFVNDRHAGRFIRITDSTKPARIINNVFIGRGELAIGPAKMITNLVADKNLLVDRRRFDFRLAPGAAAIDTGSDPGSANGFRLWPLFHYVHPAGAEPRVPRGKIDIGAYEFAPK